MVAVAAAAMDDADDLYSMKDRPAAKPLLPLLPLLPQLAPHLN